MVNRIVLVSKCSRQQEATSGVIQLQDDDPLMLEKMLEYLYTGKYSRASAYRKGYTPEDYSAVYVHIEVYSLGEKYNISGLKNLARHYFGYCVWFGWNRFDFSSVIRDVFTSTPESDSGLRNLVLSVAQKNIEALRERKEFDALLKELPEFTLNLFDEELKVNRSAEKRRMSSIELCETFYCKECIERSPQEVRNFIRCRYCGDPLT